MSEELPSEFDLVVIGTGFAESIVAAAASRIGKTVLHLDPNEYYGSSWASFNLESLQNFVEEGKKDLNTNADDTTIGPNFAGVIAAEHEWHIESKAEDSEIDAEWTKEKVLKEFRKFNIDLVPKLLFSSGKLVELLISSNISRYTEFRAIDNVCTIFEGQIRNVPCSRTDVFNSKDLTIVEKRLLMKLLSQCMNYEENPEEFAKYEDKTFLDFLHENHLTEKIVHCVLNAISMSSESTTFNEGMQKIRKFLSGLGRYGNTPFLFPMYGCGEIPQCFCRLCAVFGGLYCLKKQIKNIEVEEIQENEKTEKIIKISSGEQILKAKKLVVGNVNITDNLLKTIADENVGDNKCGNLSRAVLITSSPIGNEELNSGGGGVNFLRIPNEKNGVTVLQLSHYSGTCPKGLYLIHITAESITDDPKNDLKPFVDKIFGLENPPNIIYSIYFKISRCKLCRDSKAATLDGPIQFVCGPYAELDYDMSIENAKRTFDIVFPGEEFLPRAPDPEEIVMGDEDPTAPSAVVIANEKIVIENVKEKIKEFEEGIENELSSLEEKETETTVE